MSRESERQLDVETQAGQPPASHEKTENNIAQQFAPPDGGLWAWLCVFGGFCCQFCSFGFVNA